MALREVLARFGIQVDGANQLRTTDRLASSLIASLAAMGPTVDRVIQGVGAFVNETLRMGDSLDKTSRQVGLTTDQLQRWQFNAQRAGVEATEMRQALVALQRASFMAARGTGDQATAFRRLGISVRDSSGNLKSVNDLMLEVADGLQNTENSTERVALSQILMEETGSRLLPMFAEGAEGVRRLNERFEELGGGLDRGVIDASVEAVDALADFGVATDTLRSRLAAALLPTLNRGIDTLNDMIGAFLRVTQNGAFVEAIFIAIGIAITQIGIAIVRTMLPAFRRAALSFLKWALFVLVIEDLIVLFRGGRSVIGAFIDELFGIGTAARWVHDLKEAFEGILLAIREIRRLGIIEGLRGEDPRASGRADSVEEGMRRQAASAARRGQVVPREGEDFQAALLRTNAMRAREGLAPVNVQGPGMTATAPSGRRGNTTNNVEINSPITIQTSGNASDQALTNQLDQILNQRNREAAAALGQAGGTED